MKQEKEYFAFISYKREDEKWAKWLADGLEHYRLPTTMNGKDLPKNLRPVFRDVDELSAGNLPEQIYHALSISKNLVIVCSPRSVKSEWVNKEIKDFIAIKGGKTDNIYPFIIESPPLSKDIKKECFPDPLQKLPNYEERLGGNVNEQGGRNAALVKIVAGMLGVSFDSLWQRHIRNERKKKVIGSALFVFILLVSVFVGYILYNQRNSIRTNYYNLLSMQTRYVSKEAINLLERENTIEALLLLKHLDSIPRPYVSEYEATLRTIFDRREFMPYKYISFTHHKKSSKIQSSAYSSDGKYFALGMEDSIIYILNTSNWKVSDKLKIPNRWACFCFNYDNTKLLVGAFDKSGLYDIKTQKRIMSFKNTDYGRMIGSVVKYSSNYKHIITLDLKKECVLWDANTLRPIRKIKTKSEIIAMDMSPCEPLIAFALKDTTAVVCNLETGKEISSLKGHRYSLNSISFSPDGQKIITSSDDYTARLWNTYTGKQIALLRHNSWVLGASFSPDGNYVMTCGPLHSAYLWETRSWYQTLVIDGISDRSIYSSRAPLAAFTPDGRFIVTGSCEENEDLRLWSITDSNMMTVLKCSDKIGDDIKYVSYNDDEKKLVITKDTCVQIWDAEKKKIIKEIANQKGKSYYAVIRPDGRQVAILSELINTNTSLLSAKVILQLVNLSNYKKEYERVINRDDTNCRPEQLCYSSNSRYLFMGTFKGDVICLDSSSGEDVPSKEIKGTGGRIYKITVSEDGRYVALGTDVNIKIFDISNKEKKCTNIIEVKAWPLRFINNSSILLSYSSYNGKYILVDVTSGKVTCQFDENTVTSMNHIAPNNKYVLTSHDTYSAEFHQPGKLLKINDLRGNVIGSVTLNSGIGPCGQSKSYQFSNDGRKIIVSIGPSVLIINMNTIEELKAKMYTILKGKNLLEKDYKNYYLR